MEASEHVVKSKYCETHKLYMTPIANIRTELKLFNSIFYLDMSPMKDLILDPNSYKEPNIQDRITNFQYSGYVRAIQLCPLI